MPWGTAVPCSRLHRGARFAGVFCNHSKYGLLDFFFDILCFVNQRGRHIESKMNKKGLQSFDVIATSIWNSMVPLTRIPEFQWFEARVQLLFSVSGKA